MAGQQFTVGSLGGSLSQPYLTQKLRSVAQPMFRFRQFVDVKEAIGKNRGNTWLYDKISNVATQGGTLVVSASCDDRQVLKEKPILSRRLIIPLTRELVKSQNMVIR